MKKILLLAFVSLVCLLGFSQQNVGVGTNTPLTKLDVQGALALREGVAITVTSPGAHGGANDNIALPDITGTGDVASFYHITTFTGTAGAFSIYGIAPNTGANGQVVTIINATGKVMTIVNNNSSTSANNIYTPSGANMVDNASSTTTSSITLQYSKTAGGTGNPGWVVTATENYIISVGTVSGTTVSNNSNNNSLTTTVDGVTGTGVNIVNNVSNSWTESSGLITTVNGVTGTAFSPASGTITQVLGYNSSGTPVYQAATSEGVTSFSAGATGLTPNSATTGAVTLAGTLGVANGGTGLNSTPANGSLDIGNGTGFTNTTLTAGSGVSITNGAGSIGIAESLPITSLTVTGSSGSATISSGILNIPTYTLAGLGGQAAITAGTGLSFSGTTLNSVWTLSGSNLYNNAGTYVGIGTTSPPAPFSAIYGTYGTNTSTGAANWYDPTLYSGYAQNNNNAAEHYGFLVSDYWRSSENFLFACDGRYYNNGTTTGDTHYPYFIVRGDGNVGIGTAAPGNLLDVEGGNIDASGYVMAGGTGGGALMFSGTTAVNGGGISGGISFCGRPRIGDWGQFLTIGEPNGTYNGNILQISNNGIYTGTSTSITSAPTVRNVLDNGSGKMGIGTTSPTSLFSVGSGNQFQVNSSGNLVEVNNVAYSWPSSQGSAGQVLENNGSGTLSWVGGSGTGSDGYWTRSGTDLYNTNTGDNVGIGTASPGQRLDVAGVINVQGAPSSGLLGSGSRILLATGGTDVTSLEESWGVNITGSATQPVKVYGASFMVGYQSSGTNYGTGNMYVSGTVGIGTTSPPAPFSDVYGSAGTNTSTGGANWYDPTLYSGYVQNNNNASEHYGLLISDYWRSSENFLLSVDGRYYNNGTTTGDTHNPYFIVRGDGNVGVGTSGPDNKLEVNGSVRVDANPIYLNSGTDNNHYIVIDNSSSTNANGPDIAGYYGYKTWSTAYGRLGTWCQDYATDATIPTCYGSLGVYLGYTFYYGGYFDTKNDLDAIDAIKPMVSLDTTTGHTRIVNDPATVPFGIAHKNKTGDYYTNMVDISYLAVGAIRELRNETKTRDEALAARVDRLEKLVSQLTGKQLGEMDFSATATAYKGMENYVIMDARISANSKIVIEGLDNYEIVNQTEGSFEIKFKTPPADDTKFTYSAKF